MYTEEWMTRRKIELFLMFLQSPRNVWTQYFHIFVVQLIRIIFSQWTGTW